MKSESYMKEIKKRMDSQQVANEKLEKQRRVSNFFKHPFNITTLKYLIIPLILGIVYLYTPLGEDQNISLSNSELPPKLESQNKKKLTKE